MKWIWASALAIVFSNLAQASGHQLCSGYLPENDLYISEAQAMAGRGIVQSQFNDILNRIQRQYANEFAKYGARLVVERKWSDGTVNAYAWQDGNNWIISMFGGFARHPSITYDGFAMVACHEIGHHIGGAPVKPASWASNEGQSDYYAAVKCLKRLFANDDNEKILNGRRIDATIKANCQNVHRSRQDQLLCMRVGMAGISMATVLQSMGGGNTPKVTTPDTTRVSSTMHSHPPAQCRLDTTYQGGLCSVSPYAGVSDRNAATGYCFDATTYPQGRRPRCWFAR